MTQRLIPIATWIALFVLAGLTNGCSFPLDPIRTIGECVLRDATSKPCQ